jgi:aldehyde dehydrogenase (NAD+)
MGLKAEDTAKTRQAVLDRLGIGDVNPGGYCGEWLGSGPELASRSPIDGEQLATVQEVTPAEYEQISARAHAAFVAWRGVPAPQRGQTVRILGELLRRHKDDLGALVSLENGKILAEGRGEVQEMVDICDFSLGLSRQLYGLTMHSERPGHRMYEHWHPLGVVGVISAFNFPVAVWAWNAAVAAVCGDAMLWKPSSQTPLTAIACTKLAERACRETGADPAIFSLAIGGGRSIGEALLHDRRIPLVSATGSCRLGHRVGEVVHQRLARTILELGGNNAIIVTSSADLDLAVPAILFGAVGTAGQRCTSTRRVIIHESVREALLARLVDAYGQIRIGNPLDPGTLMGPLIDESAVSVMMSAIERARKEGGRVRYGGEHLTGADYPGGRYVTPCIVGAEEQLPIVCDETFAPLLYVLPYRTLDDAIAMHNAVPQGLSSAIFTTDLREAEQFLAASGSDCGIANVNIGTSGAEIGGAFGGEKDTGGGRESGSDSWKAYMRRQTTTINYSHELPLAQGIEFGGS